MQVTLLYSAKPRHIMLWTLWLPDNTSVRQALNQSNFFVEYAEYKRQAPESLLLAVWSKRVCLEQLLHDGDRLEVLRPLRVDPMVARRERFKGQGVKSAGLFAARRAGAKAGY
jgi:putative ubiquitin-RnfH superfamily antitoxin RatB of RatAB toxin-antitoxin module